MLFLLNETSYTFGEFVKKLDRYTTFVKQKQYLEKRRQINMNRKTLQSVIYFLTFSQHSFGYLYLELYLAILTSTSYYVRVVRNC